MVAPSQFILFTVIFRANYTLPQVTRGQSDSLLPRGKTTGFPGAMSVFGQTKTSLSSFTEH